MTVKRGNLAEHLVELTHLPALRAAVLNESRAALTSLIESLASLDGTVREQFFEATAELEPALAKLVADAADEVLPGRALRDLRTVLRRLRCVLHNLTAFESDGSLTAEQLHVRYAQVDLAAEVRRCFAAFRPLAARRGVACTLEAAGPLVVTVDAAKFETVLLNLLFNAFKYTPERGHVTCSLERDDEADEVVLTISDSGPGISPAQTEKLFSHQRQSDRSVFLSANGVRFSLGTSRDLVSLQGGVLRLVPHPSAGALFRVRLPAHPPQSVAVLDPEPLPGALALHVAEVATSELAVEAALPQRPVTASNRPLVLVVGSNRSIQRILVESFSDAFQAVSALDEPAGLERALQTTPDVIVIDLQLPALDGRELIAGLKRQPRLVDVPLMVLTDDERPEHIIQLLQDGVLDVVRKPFLLPELRARANNLISTKRARDVLNATVGHHEGDMLKLATDVTKHQQHLQQTLNELEQARRALDAANRVKSNFLRVMSHELKTPITAMQLHVRLLERDPQAKLSPKAADGLQRIFRSSRRLNHLVDTALHWARVESGRLRLELEPFNLGDVVTAVTTELGSYAQQKGLELAVTVEQPSPPMLTSDRKLAQLVLYNIVERAVQLTEEGVVRITLRHRDGAHHVSVRDGATQLDARDENELFDPLPLGDLHERSGGGSGLGLHVVRDLARAMGGDVELGPTEATGNTFTLRLTDQKNG
ncbi:MAG: response regulator [Archangium sp.]|nr:response regulator [Archangium sp.]